MSRLSAYIKNIDSKRPINLPEFFKLVDSRQLTRRRVSGDVTATKIQGQLYIITNINDDLMKELRCLIVEKSHDRAAAATQNKSHSVNVNGSYLLVRCELNDPLVVMIDQHGDHRSNLIQSAEALVIENRQNFIDIDLMVNFLEKRTAFKLSPGMNVIFSDGNQISNILHKNFLSKYTCLHLCMDVDLGGLRITKNLMALLPNTTINFLVPDDISKRLDKVVERADDHTIDEVINIGLSTTLLEPYAALIKDKQKTLEQESYLHGE